MKRFVVLSLLALELMVAGCGNSVTNPTAVNTGTGTWEAALTGGTGDASLLNFVTTYSVNNDGSLSVTGFTFITDGPCFVASTASGTADLTTNGTLQVTGPVSFTIQSQNPAGNTLSLTGNELGTTITGTWSLTGSQSCTASGSFTMTKH